MARSSRELCGLVLTWMFLAAAGASMQADAQDQRGPRIATLLVAGSSVTLNGQPAANGMLISSRDIVATGQDSSARLNFFDGGWVQLDANSFLGIFVETREYLRCWILVILNTGELYSKDNSACFRHGPFLFFPQSEFNLRVGSGGAVLTVLAGKVTVVGPQRSVVAPRRQITITGSRIIPRPQVTPDELPRITNWRHQYRFAPPVPPVPITRPHPQSPHRPSAPPPVGPKGAAPPLTPRR